MDTTTLSNGARALQTGRLYQDYGQIIIWHGRDFVDIARGIPGRLTGGPAEPTSTELLREYDSGRYDYSIPQTVRRELEQHAKEAIDALTIEESGK